MPAFPLLKFKFCQLSLCVMLQQIIFRDDLKTYHEKCLPEEYNLSMQQIKEERFQCLQHLSLLLWFYFPLIQNTGCETNIKTDLRNYLKFFSQTSLDAVMGNLTSFFKKVLEVELQYYTLCAWMSILFSLCQS